MNDSWVSAYQELLELEKCKVDEYGLMEPPDPRSLLSDEEIKLICQKHGIQFMQFLSSDLLVRYSDRGWRTMHFDLIYRIIHIRNLEPQVPIPLEYKIEIQSEPVPNFGYHKFAQVLPKLIPKESLREIILLALSKSKYEGLSSHQLPIVEELLSRKSKYTTAAIVAPTASGKTLAFFLPVLIKAVERSIEGRTGVSSILIYPRKALERDQLQSCLAMVDSVNKFKGVYVTIGIDDGDTKRLNEIKDGDTYRGLRCIQCSNTLIIEKKGNMTKVKCNICSKEYPYILASKEEVWQKKPTILITNIHTIYRRLLTPITVNMFVGIDYIIFDEAHVYTDYLGGHVFHIVRLLRYATCSNGFVPYFIFSSATIPNPHDFISKLAGCETDEIFYIDYRKTIEKVQGIGRRLMLYLYLLPHPDFSVETLTEALVLAVTLWCHKHNLKAITFVDSVAEISTLSDYVHTTILDKRQGREVTDHLYNTNNAPENSYNWFPLAPPNTTTDLETFKRFVLNQYKASIDIHYGQLSLSERVRVEYDFSRGLLKVLLSTSTLELGIDLSNVAAIIQHKLPITPEGVVQRVGRSGRSPDCMRVALGIIALQSSPLSTLYMFDERLRGRLADPGMLPPARVGQASANIRLQHILSLLLFKRALEGKPTFISGDEYLRTKQAVINAAKEIVSELNEELLLFNAKVGLFKNENMIKNQIIEFKTLLSDVVDATRNVDRYNFSQVKERWEEILVNIENKVSTIQQTLRSIENLREMLEKIPPLERVISELESLRNLLRRAFSLYSTLLSSARTSYRTGDEGPIKKWYKENSSDVERIANETPDSDEILTKIHSPLLELFIMNKGDYRIFRKKYGFGYDDISQVITDITTSFGSQSEKGLASSLRELPNEAEFLQSVNLSELTAHESLRRIESELKINPQGIDIFNVINLLLLNKIRFSLMLEPPAPELQLAGVEET
jgi:superfamily II DNA or RNA helicase